MHYVSKPNFHPLSQLSPSSVFNVNLKYNRTQVIHQIRTGQNIPVLKNLTTTRLVGQLGL